MTSISDELKKHLYEKKATVLDLEAYTRFAIFVPVIEIRNELHFIFQIRSRTVQQPGEVCFPGGKVEPEDYAVKDAAVRELSEELGVRSSSVSVLGELDYLVTPFRIILFPFIGTLQQGSELNINKEEVEDVFYAPVSQLMAVTPKEHHIKLEVEPDKNFPFHLIPNGKNYNWRTGIINEQFYEFNGHVIWGLTARILTNALQELKKGGFRP